MIYTFVVHKVFGELFQVSRELEELNQLVEIIERDDGVFGVSGHVDDLVTRLKEIVALIFPIKQLNCRHKPCKCLTNRVAVNKLVNGSSGRVVMAINPSFPVSEERLSARLLLWIPNRWRNKC